MAHFAELNSDNIVINIVVVDNSILINDNGDESEQKGIDFLKSTFGNNRKWIQTSYNQNIRKNFAGIGYKYDEVRDAFISPQPYPSWVLNEDNCLWESPVPLPDDENPYDWNEDAQTWDLLPEDFLAAYKLILEERS